MAIRHYSQMTTFGEERELLEEQYGDIIQLFVYRGYDLEQIFFRDEEEISQIMSEVSDMRLKEREPYNSGEKIYRIDARGDVGGFSIDFDENNMRIDGKYYTIIGSNPFLTVLDRQTDWELVPE